jgi:ABC-type multidrug transport system fused ATPase/permease subunit
MLKIRSINSVFLKEELTLLCVIFFGLLIVTGLDVLSFVTIIPVFQIIFSNEIPQLFLFKNLITKYNFDHNLKFFILLLFLFIFSLKNVLVIFFNYFYINFFQKINTRISSDLFSLFLRQEYIFFLRLSQKNFLQKVTNDINNLNSWLLSLISFLTEIVFVIGISFLLIVTNFKIFLFSFFTFIIVGTFYVYFFKNRIRNWSHNYRVSIGRTQDLVSEGLRGFKDLVIYKLDNSFVNDFKYNANLTNQSVSRINFLNNVQKYWLEIVGIFSITIALLYFVFTDFNISLLVPVFGLFVIVIFRFLSSFSRIILHGQNLKFFFPSFKAVSDEFQTLKDNKIDLAHKDNFEFSRTVEMHNVSFSYLGSDQKILKNLNFKFYKNQCIGILGKNGSGKSTFLNLIAGLIKASEGKVMIDGVYDLYSNRTKWIEDLSYVQQNIFLLNTSIKHNITLTKQDSEINHEKYEKVLKTLRLKEYFKDYSEGLDSITGIDGVSLSGGQKQLISLARALYKNSNILILDEPTSALDSTKIELFRELILSLKKTKTIFFVTHNKDYFYNFFDQCIEIDAGQIRLLKS